MSGRVIEEVVTAESVGGETRWPADVREVLVTSSFDGSRQRALFLPGRGDSPAPLLVALHSWSTDFRNPADVPYAMSCVERGWAFIHPDFQGPNHRPEAAGTDRTIQDVLDAVAFADRQTPVDPARVYLCGVSGGGHLALLLAAREPHTWAGVSSWVPITDLAAWYEECHERGLPYAADIVRIAGGDPRRCGRAAAECAWRSPLTWLRAGCHPPLDINAGIHDGHSGSVPVSHALLAFNAVAVGRDRLSPEQIHHFVDQAAVPPELTAAIQVDPAYGRKRVLFRRQSAMARITIFEGGHEIIHDAALSWLERQQRA